MGILTNVGAIWVGQLLGEEPERSRELGPAPIGSDPWLDAQVRAALAREPALRGVTLVVEVSNAAVTIRGAAPSIVEHVERAAHTVLGIKALHLERSR